MRLGARIFDFNYETDIQRAGQAGKPACMSTGQWELYPWIGVGDCSLARSNVEYDTCLCESTKPDSGRVNCAGYVYGSQREQRELKRRAHRESGRGAGVTGPCTCTVLCSMQRWLAWCWCGQPVGRINQFTSHDRLHGCHN